MIVSARATNSYFCIDSDSILFMPLSPQYIAGKMMIVRAIEAGCELIAESPSLTPFSAHYGRVSLLPIVPAQIRGLVSKPGITPDLIDSLIVGGAPVSLADENLLIDLGYNAFATYGMTETCSHVALRRFGSSFFEAMPSVFFTVDSDKCLIIHSIPDTYSWSEIRTNDVVELVSEHSFIWKGRKDFTINSGGVKIHPEEEEMRLRRAGLCGEFYLTSANHDVWGEAVVIVIEGLPDDSRADDVMALCREFLPRYSCPKRIIFEKKISRTESGKIIRKKY